MAVKPLLPGDPLRVGPFNLEARIGQGGMGAVFLGRAPGSSTPAAVKIIRADLVAEDRLRARFRREVGIARRVRSQVTALVLDADAEGNPPWVAFEYIDGPTLHELVEAGALRTSVKVGILAGIAEALVALHDAGLTHRDLKPSNVLVPPDGVKVIDFGIAASLDATRLTSSGAIIGTPAWLSPEQIEGDPVGIESDVFSWGLLAVYLTTGRHPFGADIPDRTLMYRTVNREPDLTGVPPEVLAVTRMSLSKVPSERPSAHDLARLLLPSGAAYPDADRTRELSATVPMSRTVTVRRHRGRRWWVPLVAASVCAVVATTILVLLRGRSAHPTLGPGVAQTTVLAPYRDPATGFVISRPPNWTSSRSGTQTFFSDPTSGAYLLVEYRSPAGSSAIRTWQLDEPALKRQTASYARVSMSGDDSAATWEYTYVERGATHHVLDYGLVVSGGRYGFSLAAETDEAHWRSYQGTFAAMRASFLPPA